MWRFLLVFVAAVLLSGCGIDGGFERGYIISQSDVDMPASSDSVDE